MPRKNPKKLVTKAPKSRAAAPSSWTRDQLEALIEEMKMRPELYGNSRPNLGDTKRSLMDLTKALKPVRPNVTMEDVKSHIRAIRDQYYHEVARLEKNKKMNITDDTPRLWCFSKLSFLSETGGCLEDSDEDNRSESPMSDIKTEPNDTQEEEEFDEDEDANDEWAKEFLERYFELKETKSSEHRAFLKFVKSQLRQITNYDILSRTKLGMLQELELGYRLQKESDETGIANGNTSSKSANNMYDDRDDDLEDV